MSFSLDFAPVTPAEVWKYERITLEMAMVCMTFSFTVRALYYNIYRNKWRFVCIWVCLYHFVTAPYQNAHFIVSIFLNYVTLDSLSWDIFRVATAVTCFQWKFSVLFSYDFHSSFASCRNQFYKRADPLVKSRAISFPLSFGSTALCLNWSTISTRFLVSNLITWHF